MAEQRPPRWNIASVCAPFVGHLAGFLLSLAGEGVLWHREIIDEPAIVIWAVFCVFGLIAAGIALFRKERLWGITAIGFALNAPLPFLVLYFVTCEITFKTFGM
jgi:hypothetical protein